jgi:hypothetical protein
MSANKSPLDDLKIASPCSASWNEMYGSDRKRFCGECKLNVYNLSGMTRDEAESLLVNSEGSLCIRYYRRSDGTVLTKDCPVGWAKVCHRLSAYATAALSLLLTFLAGMITVSVIRKAALPNRSVPRIFDGRAPEQIMGAIAVSPNASKRIDPQPMMGNVSVPVTKAAGENANVTVGRVQTRPSLKD